MSTCVHLACLDHNPPLISENESEQHASERDIEKVRSWVVNRDVLVDLWERSQVEPVEYFLRNTLRFLSQHKTCRIGCQTEYGEWIDVGYGLPAGGQWGDDHDY